ncbi:hypothetical protein MMPV_006786 [Pyropia vietnamensis]
MAAAATAAVAAPADRRNGSNGRSGVLLAAVFGTSAVDGLVVDAPASCGGSHRVIPHAGAMFGPAAADGLVRSVRLVALPVQPPVESPSAAATTSKLSVGGGGGSGSGSGEDGSRVVVSVPAAPRLRLPAALRKAAAAAAGAAGSRRRRSGGRRAGGGPAGAAAAPVTVGVVGVPNTGCGPAAATAASLASAAAVLQLPPASTGLGGGRGVLPLLASRPSAGAAAGAALALAGADPNETPQMPPSGSGGGGSGGGRGGGGGGRLSLAALQAALPGDGCGRIEASADLAGAAVAIARGGCAFYTKVLAAQAAGAAGVVVVNAPAEGDRLANMERNHSRSRGGGRTLAAATASPAAVATPTGLATAGQDVDGAVRSAPLLPADSSGTTAGEGMAAVSTAAAAALAAATVAADRSSEEAGVRIPAVMISAADWAALTPCIATGVTVSFTGEGEATLDVDYSRDALNGALVRGMAAWILCQCGLNVLRARRRGGVARARAAAVERMAVVPWVRGGVSGEWARPPAPLPSSPPPSTSPSQSAVVGADEEESSVSAALLPRPPSAADGTATAGVVGPPPPPSPSGASSSGATPAAATAASDVAARMSATAAAGVPPRPPPGTTATAPATASPAVAAVASSTDDEADDEVCAVCLDAFVSGVLVTPLPCGHVYHAGCISPWLLTSSVCPVCKRVVGGLPPCAWGGGTDYGSVGV